MKRKLSLLLAIVMILSLVPMSAFAASKTRVDKVPSVAADHDFLAAGNEPTLYITEDKDAFDDGTNGGEIFRLVLTNAKWPAQADLNAEFTDAQLVTRLSDSTVEVVVYGTGATDEYAFPLVAEVTDEGEVKVTVDNRDSIVSSGTYTFAVAGKGKTVATVDKSKTIQYGSGETGARILIDEVTVGAVDESSKVEFVLPDGFEWTTGTVVKDFNGATISTYTIDKEELTVTFNPGAAGVRRTAFVTPVIKVTKDADLGDVLVDIHGGGDVAGAKDLLVAKYKDYAVTVELDSDLEKFNAGVVANDEIEVLIEESIANSLIDGRMIEFELPEWAQIQDGKNVTYSINGGVEATIETGDETENTSEFEFKWVDPGTSGADDILITLPLTFEADQAGDLVLTVKGAGIEEQEVKIAEVIAPITAEVKVADVKIGIQDQDAPEIIITENVEGALIEGGDLVLSLSSTLGMTFEDADFEVISGDLKLGDSKVNDHSLVVEIDRDSHEASKIRVYNIKMTLDRTVPEGPFDLSVGGSALVENADYNDEEFANNVAKFKFANVVTKAGGTVATTSKFVIGSTTYKVLVGGVEVEKTMDVAAFIQDGRTFLPIRFVAEALGVSTDNIVWNNEARTVTIMKGDRVAQMVIGSNVLTVNGVAVPMDTAAMIKDGRTVLPVRYVAQALGAEILWDAATQTVTVNQ
ncbi:MAG: hypothetical protein K0R93_518 [Anaerosolibacter sp.]|jgi:hypothetical protein|uniref:copper amine oxidase N-terminal domain-containing protein n=1 Tax=Anaerosolibacter sp. TaxID=1872527 RepID=UPI0026163DCF|nr:copper amine oxidase N-terminal domain-containing protein [Anaerosolibacter sp.]MDF2545620.1 hypothetical protein [Anaerosolibacter sp.]